MKPLALASLLLPLLFSASSGCVDPCVLSGAPCDSHTDCDDGDVCRLRRGSEVGCLFAAGTCVAGSCGSVEDCAAEECCDPDSSSCISADDYQGPCGPRTCGDCPECSFGFCEERGGLVSCGSDENCADDEACRDSVCRAVCDYDSDCPQARCSSGTCSEPFGTPCESGADCAGLGCYDLTPAGATRPGYCSASCGNQADCPLGHYFVCKSGECRMP